MDKKIIETSEAPKPVGPYSQAVQSGGFLFCSGQIAIDPKTDQVLQVDVATQTKQVMQNIKAVLAANDLTFDHVIKTTIYLTSMKDFATVNDIYKNYFTSKFPARSTVEVSGLPKGVNVEVEVLASVR